MFTNRVTTSNIDMTVLAPTECIAHPALQSPNKNNTKRDRGARRASELAGSSRLVRCVAACVVLLSVIRYSFDASIGLLSRNVRNCCPVIRYSFDASIDACWVETVRMLCQFCKRVDSKCRNTYLHLFPSAHRWPSLRHRRPSPWERFFRPGTIENTSIAMPVYTIATTAHDKKFQHPKC
jgi:hypothetical protein